MYFSIEQAVKDCRRGAYATFVWAGFTAVLLGLLLYTRAGGSTDASGTQIDTWELVAVGVDFVFISLCGVALLKKQSRAAALLVCFSWVLNRIYALLSTSALFAHIGALVFLYLFVRAILGSFGYHKLRREQNPDYQPAPKWVYRVGIPAAAIYVLGFSYMLLDDIYQARSDILKEGAEVSPSDRRALIERGIMHPDEQVRFLYPGDQSSIVDSGLLMTNARVLDYISDEAGRLDVYAFYWDEIREIRVVQRGALLSHSVFRVNGVERGAWMEFSVPTRHERDWRLYHEIRSQIQ